MVDLVTVGDPPIEVIIRRSRTAKRLTLRVPSIGGEPVLTAPMRVRDRVLDDFLMERVEWLRAAMGRIPQPQAITDGTILPVDGTPLTVALTEARRVSVEGQVLSLPRARAGPAALGWLKTVARDRIAPTADHYAAQIGKPYTGLSLRDPRSRWGSCSSEGRLMLSWRLILAPVAVRDYVVAHEVAHLVEMNHSDRFWALTEQLYPDWRAQRDWLREQGATLHQWRFD